MSRRSSGFRPAALLLAFGAAGPVLGDGAERSLCAATEAIVFSCHLGSKTVSLCRPAAVPRSLVYRYGRLGAVELAVAGGGRSPATVFRVETRPLVGGGETRVSFERRGLEYRLYSRLGRSGGTQGEPEFEDGLVVVRHGGAVQRRVCDNGGAGFRESLEWLPTRTGG